MLGVDHPLVGVARVERERDLVRDGGREIRLDVHPADRGHGRRAALERDADHGGDDLGEARHRVETSLHRPGTGVVGAAGELDHVVADRGDRVDDADRQPFGLQDRPLLDVHLDPRVEVVPPGLGYPLRIEAHAAHGLPDRHALAVAYRFRLLRRDRADDRPRAPEVGRVEAARLLLAQRHRFERTAGGAELLAQRAQGDQRGDDAERAVVAPAGGLRVDVRPGCDHRAALAPGELPPHAADRVAADLEPRLGHPGGDLVLGGDPLRRVHGAPDPGLPVRAVACELEQEPLDEARVDVDQASSSAAPRTTASARRSRRAA